MSKPRSGLYWHVHHNTLVEWCYDEGERIGFINMHKSTYEIATRLRLMRPVKGELPKEVVEAGVLCGSVMDALDKARRDYIEARKAHDKAYNTTGRNSNETLDYLNKAVDARDGAEFFYDEAVDACDRAVEAHLEAIEKLHAEECPNCPWDGRRVIFG